MYIYRAQDSENGDRAIAVLHATSRGECFNVYAQKTAKECGIASEIISRCFTDPDITQRARVRGKPCGVNPLLQPHNELFGPHNELKNIAEENSMVR